MKIYKAVYTTPNEQLALDNAQLHFANAHHFITWWQARLTVREVYPNVFLLLTGENLLAVAVLREDNDF